MSDTFLDGAAGTVVRSELPQFRLIGAQGASMIQVDYGPQQSGQGYAQRLAAALGAELEVHGHDGQGATSLGVGGYAGTCQRWNPGYVLSSPIQWTREARTADTSPELFVMGTAQGDAHEIGIPGVAISERAQRRIIDRWWAAQVMEDDDPACVYSGGTTVAKVDRNSGASTRVFTAGGQVSVTNAGLFDFRFPGGEVVVQFVGTSALAGNSVTVTVDGTVRAVKAFSGSDVSSYRGAGPLRVPIGRLTAGAHTVVVAVALSAGQIEFDCFELLADEPPLVLVQNLARFSSYGWGVSLPVPPSDAIYDAYNTMLQGLCASYANERVRYVDVDAVVGRDPSLLGYDGIHWADRGHEMVAGAFLGVIDRPSPRLALRSGTNAPGARGTGVLSANWALLSSFGSVSGQPVYYPYSQRVSARVCLLGGGVRRTGAPTAGETILVLPRGFRPSEEREMVVATDTGAGRITLKSDGRVLWQSGHTHSTGWIDLASGGPYVAGR